MLLLHRGEDSFNRRANMKMPVRSFFLSLLLLGAVTCVAPSRAALITDSTTFTGFLVTYDSALWGNIRFPHEADSFSQTLPISQFGFGRWTLQR